MLMVVSIGIGIFFARIHISLKNHAKVEAAIYNYTTDQRRKTKQFHEGEFHLMEPMWVTAIRFWDFGCKNIVPKWYYDEIKSFIV